VNGSGEYQEKEDEIEERRYCQRGQRDREEAWHQATATPYADRRESQHTDERRTGDDEDENCQRLHPLGLWSVSKGREDKGGCHCKQG